MYVVRALNPSPCVRGFVKLWITLALSYGTVPSHRQILGLYRSLGQPCDSRLRSCGAMIGSKDEFRYAIRPTEFRRRRRGWDTLFTEWVF